MTDQNRFSGLMGGLKGDSEVEPKSAPKSPAKGKAKKAASQSAPKSKDASYQQIGLYLPKELHRRMKAGSAIAGKEMSDVAAEAVELWLKKNVPNI